MGWADSYIKTLSENKSVQFRPIGHSMEPRILSGQLVTVVPFDDPAIALNVGDIVLCQVGHAQYLHLIKEIIDKPSEQFLIGNNKGKINAWIHKDCIFGKCIKIED